MDTAEKTYNVFYDRYINTVIMEWRGYATSRNLKKEQS